jgi:hypothetical protein
MSESLSRREFFRAVSSSLVILEGLFVPSKSLSSRRQIISRFGVVTDLHYADTETRGNRYYRESVGKLQSCLPLLNSSSLDFLIELGDFKDQDEPPAEKATLQYLRSIEAAFRQFRGPTFHVLGNHDMDSLSKIQVLSNIQNSRISGPRGYYSFDSKAVHFVVLDANFSSNGQDYDHSDFDWRDCNIPAPQLAWLRADLAAATRPVIVFVHQLLDGEGDVFVKNAPEVRSVLEHSGKVIAVFQGHHHEGRYTLMQAIHYCTLKAMVDGSGEDNNSCAIVEVHADGSLMVRGFWKAATQSLEKQPG